MNEVTGILLGFDFGTKRIGVAVGQTITGTARPLSTIQANKGTPNWSDVSKLINNWHPSALVIGLPLNMDGTEQPLTQAAKEFAQQLGDRYAIPVYTVDERLTTRDARERTFNKGGFKALQKTEMDSVAAQLILETWFSLNETK